MSGIFYGGKWYPSTGLICRKCGHPVYKSDNPEYSYQCFYCDEDMYTFETRQQNPCHLPPVMVARPIDGITVNEQIEYLLDNDGKPRIFKNQFEAEVFLLENGFDREDLESFFFEEYVEEEDGDVR